MLYSFLKIFIGTARHIFCRKVFINRPEMLREKGPLLLACNHPNSFLDAVILDLLFKQPIWSLARGDAFINKFVGKIMWSLKMLPVYRPSEGVENLSENYKTFDACIELFKRNGVVLIFSEGLCVNEWHLRSLKKGTARLAGKCLDEKIPLRVLPVGINYSSYRRFGKNVFINFGNIITVNEMDANASEGVRNQDFNSRLFKELQPLVFEIDKNDKQKQKNLLEIRPAIISKILFMIPALIGWLIHLPLYLLLKNFALKKLGHTVHVDSVLIALLVFTYPVYLLLIALMLFLFLKNWWVLSVFFILPFCAWSYVQVKDQLDK
jgi:1-acyl-sn-glycerol-3-phosphate acyltransferase